MKDLHVPLPFLRRLAPAGLGAVLQFRRPGGHLLQLDSPGSLLRFPWHYPNVPRTVSLLQNTEEPTGWFPYFLTRVGVQCVLIFPLTVCILGLEYSGLVLALSQCSDIWGVCAAYIIYSLDDFSYQRKNLGIGT